MSHLSSQLIERVPKLCGADYEFQNFISNVARPDGTGYEASRLLLRQIDGYSSDITSSSQGSFAGAGNETTDTRDRQSGGDGRHAYYSQDHGRKFLPNGMCFYIDLNHLEGCIAEVISAYDHVASCHALFHHAHIATQRANTNLPDGNRITVLGNNSDGQGNSF